MARKEKNLETLLPEPQLDTGSLDTARKELAERMAPVLAQFGDGLPYDQERLIHETQFYMQQSAEAALQVGRRLVVLKEASSHGEFIEIVERRLGINHTSAKRVMQAAVKLTAIAGKSNGATSHHLLEAAGNKSKLFELMTLDTDDLEALAEGGSVANLTLDDVERMTVTELRAALREAKENYRAQAEVLSDKNTKIDKLSGELRKTKRRVQETPADQVASELLEEVSRLAFNAEAAVRGDLYNGVEMLLSHHHTANTRGNSEPKAAVAGFLMQIERALNEIYADHDIPRELVSTATPELGTVAG